MRASSSRFDTKRYFILACLITLAWAGVVYSQAPTGGTTTHGDHPELRQENRLEEAARLTEFVAKGDPTGDPTAVPRRNLIDEHIFGRMEADGVPNAPLATDEEFFRRIHLDLIGRIPNPEALAGFQSSEDPEKRDKLIDELVGGKPFLNSWTHWFLDKSRSVGGTIGTPGRNLYYDYIYDAFEMNRPFDELITDLITVEAVSNWYVGPATYLSRCRILAPVNVNVMHEDTADEITVQLFKDFMGINVQCISCHDGARHLEKLNVWLTSKTRDEFYQQAAFFGKTRVTRRANISPGRDEWRIQENVAEGYDTSAESVVRMPRTGEGMAEPAFILTGEKPRPGKNLRQELARMFTSHPQFARATVNLVWAQLMGVGLVDPPYDFDPARLDPANPPADPFAVQPTDPALLDALAADFSENGYDLHRLFRMITKSSTYQLSSKFPGEWKAAYAPYFARKFVRRLSAEQVYDSIVHATQMYTEVAVRGSHRKARYLTEVRGPEDINRPLELRDLHFFMETFGQANRRSSERTNQGSITQAVLMLNSTLVKEKIQAAPDSYLGSVLRTETPLDFDDLTDKLFLRFLMRRPSEREKLLALDLLGEKGLRKGGEDLQWGLVNKVEFIHNN